MEFDLQPQISQNQKLKMTYLMKRSFSILQMTNIELKEFLYSEIEKNPILDIKIKQNKNFSKKKENSSLERSPAIEWIKPLWFW